MKKTCMCIAAVVSLVLGASGANANLVNGGFEYPYVANQNRYFLLDLDGLSSSELNSFGWRTTASDNVIEIWPEGFSANGGPFASGGNNLGFGFNPEEGRQFAELNGTEVSTLYQDVSGIAANAIIGWSFAHRGRLGEDTIRLTITDLGSNGVWDASDFVLFSNTFTTGNSDWVTYSGYGLLSSGNNYRFAWESVSAAGSNPTFGNFLDDARFGVDVRPIPEPATLLLFGAGLSLLTQHRLRKKKK